LRSGGVREPDREILGQFVDFLGQADCFPRARVGEPDIAAAGGASGAAWLHGAPRPRLRAQSSAFACSNDKTTSSTLIDQLS
jgi:hypothetical protein